MSKYLVKQMFAVEAQEARLIDTNGLLRRRMGTVDPSWAAAEGVFPGPGAEENGAGPGEPGAVPGHAGEDAGLFLEQARAEGQEIVRQAQAEAEAILESAKAQAQQEKESVLEQARRQGYQEGQKQAQAEAAQLSAQLKEKTAQAEAAYQQQIDELEPKFVDVITSIYEQIFQVELGSQKRILEYLISKAMHRIEGAHTFLIHVSREDYAHVNAQKEQILAGAVSGSDTVDVVEDAVLGKNQCLIETEGGIFDCGLETQLTELRRKLKLLSWSGEE